MDPGGQHTENILALLQRRGTPLIADTGGRHVVRSQSVVREDKSQSQEFSDC
jgi:hypothetical protein